MAIVNLNTIKNWFKTGLKPTQTQFWSTWDSFWHKNDQIPATNIDNLNSLLDEKADSQALDHKVDKVTGKGLSEEDFTSIEKAKLSGLSQIWELLSSGYVRLKDFAKSIQIKGLIIGDTPASATDSTVYQNVIEDPTIGGELINTSSTVERTANPTGTGYYFGNNLTVTSSGNDNRTGTKGLFTKTRKTGNYNSLAEYGHDNQVILTGGGTTSFLISLLSRLKTLGTEIQTIDGVARGHDIDLELNNPNTTGYFQSQHAAVRLKKGNINGADVLFMDFDIDHADPDLNVTGDLTYLVGGGGSDVAAMKTKLEAINKKFRFIHNQGSTESDFAGIINYNGDVLNIISATNKVLVNKEYLELKYVNLTTAQSIGGNKHFNNNVSTSGTLYVASTSTLGKLNVSGIAKFSQKVGIGTGTANLTSPLQISGLPVYADNAAALSANLTAGAFYHSGDGIVRVVY